MGVLHKKRTTHSHNKKESGKICNLTNLFLQTTTRYSAKQRIF